MQFLFGILTAAVLFFIYDMIRNANRKGTKPGSRAQNLVQTATALTQFYNATAHPTDLMSHPEFQEGVDLLSSTDSSLQELIDYMQGDNPIVSCMALEALDQREDAAEAMNSILSSLNIILPWPRYFALKVLNKIKPGGESMVYPLLVRLDQSWCHKPNILFLQEFIQHRAEGNETFSFEESLEDLDQEDAEHLEELLDLLEGIQISNLTKELNQWQGSQVDTSHLSTVGRIWKATDDALKIIEHPPLIEARDQLESMLMKSKARSMLVIGEPGVGKTSIIRALAKSILNQGWHLFEAGHTELVAGQIYIGQFEERIRKLSQHLSGNKCVLWYIPDFHMLAFTGRTNVSPLAAMDLLLPFIEARQITVIGEITAKDFERLSEMHPRCATLFETIRIEPQSPRSTRELAAAWVKINSPAEDRPIVSNETLNEAYLLTEQYLEDKASPGNLLELLKLTLQRLMRTRSSTAGTLTLDDLIVTLTQMTGLPASLLDERRELDLKALRSLFEKRVIGQPEAVDCLVERLAMIKAGINDATRALGVFLFAGPTGTGKTEIAKVLTEFLFGTAARMIRLDMSEIQSPEALVRIIGDPQDTKSNALVDKIRKQPFSVVLLDEFEKAHPRVWDLFLQVFDDGRLTSQRGFTVDCRHAFFIMTSNLGAAIPTGKPLGFSRGQAPFSPDEVRQAVSKTFQKEFLNRIDRIVIFRPLTREIVREILRKELDEVSKRRGLRNRDWAVVWEEAALEFLLDKGFTVDMGARPLKRAIERHLLTPLAMTIVNHQVPEGDQFLYVKCSGKRLEVEFIDPDLPEDEPATAVQERKYEVKESVPLTPSTILLDPRGTPHEVNALSESYHRLQDALEEDDWKESKQAAFDMINHVDFWSAPDRFTILGEVEYRDRIEAGVETAGALLERLVQQDPGQRKPVSRKLVERLARQIYLLEAAHESVRLNEPRDAFILIEAAQDSASTFPTNNIFAERITEMYRAWAEKRRMNVKVIEERKASAGRPFHFLAGVSGFAAYRILHHETGLHILEMDGEHKRHQRAKVLVRVEAQPDEPVGNHLKDWKRQAESILNTSSIENLSIVRYYTEEPSPLVRDVVRNWRTGRIERVLSGDFDLFG